MRTFKLLDGATRLKDLGEDFGAGLSQREVHYFVAEDWARNADEIVWQRTKLESKLSAEQRRKLDSYLTSQAADAWHDDGRSACAGSAGRLRS